jgi:hypothetical protein
MEAQVELTEDQYRRLCELAHGEGVCVAALVRRAVDLLLKTRALDRSVAYARAAELVGRLADASGATDLATRHDEYRDEAYG